MKQIIHDKDAYGKGLMAYQEGKKNAKFTVKSNIAETERWDISVFFRNESQMPEAETIALNHCKGKVLDAGAGAGSHSLWLKNKGFEVTSIDISEGAVEVMRKRNVTDARLEDFFLLSDSQKYDTILMLMNGIGIVQSIDRFPLFFSRAKQLLNSGGRIILDSSNIIYLYEDEDGGATININGDYYGEIEYQINYGKIIGEPFKWIFIDFETLKDMAEKEGFSCNKLYEDDHYLYVAELELL